jgi:hypothetical protein
MLSSANWCLERFSFRVITGVNSIDEKLHIGFGHNAVTWIQHDIVRLFTFALRLAKNESRKTDRDQIRTVRRRQPFQREFPLNSIKVSRRGTKFISVANPVIRCCVLNSYLKER